MAVAPDAFSAWLAQAQIPESRLTSEQRGLLQAVFRFRQQQGDDYYSNRLLSHFLLHCDSGLQVAQIARLVGCSRPTASRQQGLSSKEAVQQAHHRMDGRPYGKLLPRYAGSIAEYLFSHPKATRADLLDFIDRTWGVRVSRIALYHFLKKYGLDHVPGAVEVVAPAAAVGAEPPQLPAVLLPRGVPELPAGRPVPSPAPPFSPRGRNTPAPSCCCRPR
jgi:transposase